MQTKRYAGIILLLLTGLFAPSVQAAAPDAGMRQSQIDEAREAELERQRRLHPPRLEIETPVQEPETAAEGKGAVFHIQRIEMEGEAEAFPWLQEHLRQREDRDMDLAAINRLVRELNRDLLERGYVTSRVVIPEQNLSQGTLRLVLQAGRLRGFVYGKESAHVNYDNAFPIGQGDILNLRLLEQGLEQMKRLASQDVTMRLLPSDEAGMSDVELTILQHRPIYGSLFFDDSGLKSTGKLQLGLSLTFEQPANANDILQVSVNRDAEFDGYRRGNPGWSLYYSIPAGMNTLTLSYSQSKYHQWIESAYTGNSFMHHGNSNFLRLAWNHVLERTQSRKTGMEISVRKRNSHGYINDVEIGTQDIHLAALELAFYQRNYLPEAVLYTRLACRRGLPVLFGAKADSPWEGSPTAKYHMLLLDIDYRKTFSLAHRPAVYTMSLHGQWTPGETHLYGADMLNIGNRYTVRGFDGEDSLLGESGWYLRNELSGAIPRWHSEIYLALDAGAVYGLNTEDLLGHSLIGVALGLRGEIAGCLHYDWYIGRALSYPAGMHIPRWHSGFSLELKI